MEAEGAVPSGGHAQHARLRQHRQVRDDLVHHAVRCPVVDGRFALHAVAQLMGGRVEGRI